MIRKVIPRMLLSGLFTTLSMYGILNYRLVVINLGIARLWAYSLLERDREVA